MGRPKKEKPNHASGLYEVKITIGKTLEGKLIRKSFYSSSSKADARKQAEDWQVEQRVSEQVGETFIENDVKFSSWALKWLETYKKGSVRESTYENTYLNTVKNHLVPYFGKASLTKIRPIDIQNFYKTKCSTLSESAIHKIKLCLNGIFDSAIDNDLCVKNPTKRIATPSGCKSNEKHVYTAREAARLSTFAKHHPYGLDVLLLLRAGLRRGELLGLKWEDIDLKSKLLTVRRSVSLVHNKPVVDLPKTPSSIRTIPFDSGLAKILTEKASTGYVIPNQKGKVMSPDNWMKRRYAVFMRDFADAFPDIPVLNPHELRHTCGTFFYRKTGDIYAVSKYLGHADVMITTKIYVHNDVDALRRSLKIS